MFFSDNTITATVTDDYLGGKRKKTSPTPTWFLISDPFQPQQEREGERGREHNNSKSKPISNGHFNK